MTTYLVTWSGVEPEQVMDAESPEEAARIAVGRHDFHDIIEGVEVSVWERVESRHDVILDDLN